MEYLLTPHARQVEPFAWWEGAFDAQQLDWLQQQAKNIQIKASVGMGKNGEVNPNIRRSGIHWLPNNKETTWVFSTLAHVISSLNAQYFGFDLTGFGEQIQLTNYDSDEQGMYGWHVDGMSDPYSPCRKLSIVLQLSDPVDYEGGVLELKYSNTDVVKMKKRRGLIVAFPSWTLHQVTPVTQGSRQSLVAWISGPPFR